MLIPLGVLEVKKNCGFPFPRTEANLCKKNAVKNFLVSSHNSFKITSVQRKLQSRFAGIKLSGRYLISKQWIENQPTCVLQLFSHLAWSQCGALFNQLVHHNAYQSCKFNEAIFACIHWGLRSQLRKEPHVSRNVGSQLRPSGAAGSVTVL